MGRIFVRYYCCVCMDSYKANGRVVLDRKGMATLRDLSPSLADIAAFMHEVEVQQGFVSRKNDGRGIERIRQFAYKLQGILMSEVPQVRVQVFSAATPEADGLQDDEVQDIPPPNPAQAPSRKANGRTKKPKQQTETEELQGENENPQ